MFNNLTINNQNNQNNICIKCKSDISTSPNCCEWRKQNKEKIDSLYERDKKTFNISYTCHMANFMNCATLVLMLPVCVYMGYIWSFVYQQNRQLKNNKVRNSFLYISSWWFMLIYIPLVIASITFYPLSLIVSDYTRNKLVIYSFNDEGNDDHDHDNNDNVNQPVNSVQKTYVWYFPFSNLVKKFTKETIDESNNYYNCVSIFAGIIVYIFIPLFTKLIFFDAEMIFQFYGIDSTTLVQDGFLFKLSQNSSGIPPNIYRAANEYVKSRFDLELLLVLTILLILGGISCILRDINKTIEEEKNYSFEFRSSLINWQIFFMLDIFTLAFFVNFVIISIKMGQNCYEITSHYLLEYNNIRLLSLCIIFNLFASFVYCWVSQFILNVLFCQRVVDCYFEEFKEKYDKLKTDYKNKINSLIIVTDIV